MVGEGGGGVWSVVAGDRGSAPRVVALVSEVEGVLALRGVGCLVFTHLVGGRRSLKTKRS